ncbi:hypothetical protein JKF63_06985 [Porcisia hertigi]|uniref:ATP-dependent DNA helicase n=1 Tax=Porcisia hertigi TaxID=2761500 RepID=A0A836IQA0_9TRYP|nr:hypothetical protein JKF63_06985 [Porcisia hertigi]
MGYLQVLLACYHHLAAAPVSASGSGAAVAAGRCCVDAPSCVPLVSPSHAPFPAPLTPVAIVRRRNRERWKNSAGRGACGGGWERWEGSCRATGIHFARASLAMRPLSSKIRRRQLPQSRVAAMHIAGHATARRWCHSQSTAPSSGDAPPRPPDWQPAPLSEAVPFESGDSKERPSLLGELLRRVQQTPCLLASDRCVNESTRDSPMKIGAEGEAAMPAAPLTVLDVSSAHRFVGNASTVGEEGYVPLLFRPEFWRANPHAFKHAASSITRAETTALITPTRTNDNSLRGVAESRMQAACDTLQARPLYEEQERVAFEAAPEDARSLTPLENVGTLKSTPPCTDTTASPALEGNGDVILQEYDIENIATPDLRGDRGEGCAFTEENEQPLRREPSVAATSEAPCGAVSKDVVKEQLQCTAEQEWDGVEDVTSGNTHPPAADGDALQKDDRRSRSLILDPVEWLAQAPDTPLMDEVLLQSKTHMKEQFIGAMGPASGAEYTDLLRQQDRETSIRDAETAIGEAPPSAVDVTAMTAKGFDPETAAFMASASTRSLDEDESTSLQEALVEDLYADVSRAIRRQQWSLPRKNKTKRSRAVTAATPSTRTGTNGERAVDEEHSPEAPLGGGSGAATIQGEALTPADKSGAPLPSEGDVKDTDSGALPPPRHEFTAAPLKAAPKGAETTAPAAQPDALVYNIFTHRVAKAGSITIRSLALMGIGVDHTTRELCVTDGEALRSFAGELRTHRVSWPKLWSRGSLHQQIERLLSDSAVEDPVERVAEVLKLQYSRSHQLRQKPGFVVGGDTAEWTQAPLAAASTEQPRMAESIDDKLLTIQDLNAEQQAVVDLVMQGHHTYIGGGAGTGKSVLLRVIKQQLAREGLVVAVTGTTGVAGSQIGGCTLHHCLGINPLGEFTRRKELSSYDVIIIDEVSMLSRELFESLEAHLRRANNINLPFGGVQVILSGDFLQLGAINAQPLITSAVFRRNFVHLKLNTVVRQNRNLRFAAQLRLLRRGLVPLDLHKTVQFASREEVVGKLQHVLSIEASEPTAGSHRDTLATTTTTGGNDSLPTQPAPETATGTPSPQGRCHHAVAAFVEGAVNLLPTNQEVDATNAEQLERLGGELITYTPQLLHPSLVGSWSPTYVLRVYEPQKLNIKTFALEIQRHLAAFYTHGQRASSQQASRSSARPASNRKDAVESSGAAAASSNFDDGSWLLNAGHSERSIVMYPLFVDALALRVRLPMTMDKEEAQQFLLYLSEIDHHLQHIDKGVRVRDVLLSADGMHTETDEFTLLQYAQRTPLARPLGLKIGARVMLRTNLAPGLVNGSLGTVVAFRKLEIDQLPRYIVGNAQREQFILQYADYLQYEQGFQLPLVPVVDFNGRQEVIPPVAHYVGGMPNTHHYSMGIVALPLSLAYAFTVHKVQGLTLVGRVHLELSRMWPCEHLLYVAMSRVRNPEQLSVSSFHPRLVRAAAHCLLFDDSLPPVTEAKIPPYMVTATWRRSEDRRKRTQLRNRLEAYAKRRQQKLQSAASRGDVLAEIRLLEEKMLKQRARASVARSRTTPLLQS